MTDYDRAHNEVWRDLQHDDNEFLAALLDAIHDPLFRGALRGLVFGQDTLHSAESARKALTNTDHTGALDRYVEIEADNRVGGWGKSAVQKMLELSLKPDPSVFARNLMGVPQEPGK